jgi:hypothetical protein
MLPENSREQYGIVDYYSSTKPSNTIGENGFTKRKKQHQKGIVLKQKNYFFERFLFFRKQKRFSLDSNSLKNPIFKAFPFSMQCHLGGKSQ